VHSSQRKPWRIFYSNVPPTSAVSGVVQLQEPSQTAKSGPPGPGATAEAVVDECSKAGVVIDGREPVVAVRGSACPPQLDLGITVVGDTRVILYGVCWNARKHRPS